MTLEEINTATRDELIDYLTSWGFQCYDHETTSELRVAAIDNHNTEQA